MQHIIKDREDIWVARSGGIDSMITKSAKTREGALELANEHRFLEALVGTFTPHVFSADISATDGKQSVWHLTMQDVGDSHEITDEYAFRTDFIHMLNTLREMGISHGDLTSSNIRILGNRPYVIDWGESRYVSEGGVDKRPEGDTYHAWDFVRQTPDGARVARRWFAIYNAVRSHYGQDYNPTMLDIGCFHGDITAAASAAGWRVHGLDVDNQALEIANTRWSGLAIQFHRGQATTMNESWPEVWQVNVVTALSMFPYVVTRYGDEAAKAWITDVIDSVGLLFFESQLAGDGPGPSWMGDTDAVQSFLENCGGRDIEAICEIELPDRGTTRTVFKVIGGAS